MVADSHHREKIFKIEKKISESRKKFWNPQKYFRVKIKKKKKSRKKNLKPRKIFQNRENCFRIEK